MLMTDIQSFKDIDAARGNQMLHKKKGKRYNGENIGQKTEKNITVREHCFCYNQRHHAATKYN